MKLDAVNTVSLAAGSKEHSGSQDGLGTSARFEEICSLTADGRGSVYIADGRQRIRRLQCPPSGGQPSFVTTLRGASPPATIFEYPCWRSLSYDTVTDTLVAATSQALFRVPLQGGAPEVIAGDASTSSQLHGCWKDGCGPEAVLLSVNGILASTSGSVYLADGGALREMTPLASHVHTLSPRCFGGPGSASFHMAITGTGWLVVGCTGSRGLSIFGPGFTPVWRQRPIQVSTFVECLAATNGSGGSGSGDGGSRTGRSAASGSSSAGAQNATGVAPGAASGSNHTQGKQGDRKGSKAAAAAQCQQGNSSGSSSGVSSSTDAVLTIRVGGKAYVAHRALLARRCDYFKQLLSSEGFADSGGAAETTLEEADPEVFGRLLGWMYWGELGVPPAQLRPTAELACRLLMPGVCELLKPRLLAATTPASVVSDLLWAERHSMAGLVPALKDYFAANLKEVAAAAPAQLDELTAQSPGLAAELFRSVARARGRG